MSTRTSRNRLLAGVGVLAVAAVIVVTLSWPDGAGDPDANAGGGETDPGPALELSLGESNAFASCLAFDVAILADMPMAFHGTATAVDGSVVTLTVDRWFEGGDAQTVKLVGEHTSPALIAGFEFEPGAEYLIAAANGTVNYCGYSGPFTTELEASYEAAFTS